MLTPTATPTATAPARQPHAWLGLATAAAAASPSSSKAKKHKSLSTASILVMVNDDPITLYDVNMRAAFLGVSSGGAQKDIKKAVNARFRRLVRSKHTIDVFKKMQRDIILNNPGSPRAELIKIFRARQKRYALALQKRAIRSARKGVIPRMRSKALAELIEEHLKLQGAKKVNVSITNAEVDRVIKGIAKRNKQTPAQFAAKLRGFGSDISTLKARLKANFAWHRMINRRFGALVSVNDAQIDNVISSTELAASNNSVKLKLKRITLHIPASGSQGLIARRLQEGERLSHRFKSCKTVSQMTKGVANASYKDLGLRRVGDIAEPVRTMLLNADDGQMTPPTLASEGVVLYALCGRRAVRGDDKQRAAAKGRLRQSEFAILAKRHMRDLRAEANVCRRRMTSYTRTIAPCF